MDEKAVPVIMGGQEYKIEFGWNSLAVMEEHFGANLYASTGQQFLKDAFRGGVMSPMKLRQLMWAALQDHHEGITIMEVGRLIDQNNIQSVLAALGRALVLAFPMPSEAPSNPGAEIDPRAIG